MSTFSNGDRVKLYNGQCGVVRDTLTYSAQVYFNTGGWSWILDSDLQVDKFDDGTGTVGDKDFNKEKKMSTKYYRVIKDHPCFETGAILESNDSGTRYVAVSDVFIRDFKVNTDDWYESSELVENQQEWFERVYPIGKLEKMVFGNKKQAQAAASALYKGDEKSGKSK